MPRPFLFGLGPAVAGAALTAVMGCTGTSAKDLGDAGPDPCAFDAGHCSNGAVWVTDYDESCSADSDCVAVDNGGGCCGNMVAINVHDLAKIKAGIAACSAKLNPCARQYCTGFCAETFGPCCREGMCVADIQCSKPARARDGGADSGLSDADADTGAVAATDGAAADAGAE